MGRMQNKVPEARLYGRCRELCRRLFGPSQNVFLHLQTQDVLPAGASRSKHSIARLKVTVVVGDGRDIDIRANAEKGLLDQRAFCRAEQSALSDRRDARGHKSNTLNTQCFFIGFEKQLRLLLNRNGEWIDLMRSHPPAIRKLLNGSKSSLYRIDSVITSGDRGCLSGRRRYGVSCEITSGCESPRPADQRADSDAVCFILADVRDLPFSRGDQLRVPTRDANVRVARPRRSRRVQRQHDEIFLCGIRTWSRGLLKGPGSSNSSHSSQFYELAPIELGLHDVWKNRTE